MLYLLGAWLLYTKRGFRQSFRDACAGWVLLRRVPSLSLRGCLRVFFLQARVCGLRWNLNFIPCQKMRKQKKTMRKIKNLTLHLPEQQFGAVACQLSSEGGPQREKAKPPQNANLVVLVSWEERFWVSVSSNKFIHISRQRPLALPTPFRGPESSPPSWNLWLLIVRCWFSNGLVLYVRRSSWPSESVIRLC